MKFSTIEKLVMMVVFSMVLSMVLCEIVWRVAFVPNYEKIGMGFLLWF